MLSNYLNWLVKSFLKFTIRINTYLKTCNIYKIIERKPSWDDKFNLSFHQEAITEIIFWKNNIKIINKKVIKEYKIPSLLVCSDASNSGLASIYKEKVKANICYKGFSDKVKSQIFT